MTFVTAWLAAAGLAAMAIPILIHLFMRRRREPVRWAAMRLLQEAMRRQSRRLRLQHLIVLALRCAVLALVGAAVAQPLLRAGGAFAGLSERPGGRTVLFVIDNGLVSGVVDPGPSSAQDSAGKTALARHLATAQAVLDRLAPGDAAGVIVAARPARGLVVPPTTDHGSIAALLRSLEPAETPTDLPGALAIARETLDRLDESRAAAVYLLSDFRAGSASPSTPLSALFANPRQRELRLLASDPAAETIDNVQVTTIEPLRRLLLPGQGDGAGQLTVRLRRFGDPVQGSSRVSIAGDDIKPVAPRTVAWRSGETDASVEFIVEPVSPERTTLGISATIEPDALRPDDTSRLVLASRRVVRVALVDRRGFGAETAIERLTAGQWVARALKPSDDSPTEIVVEDPSRLTARALRGVDCAVVARPDALSGEGWEALVDLLSRGGLVIIVPPEDLNVHLWAQRLGPALGAPIELGLEPISTPEGASLSEHQPVSPLLRLLEGEIDSLAGPVRVFRRLPLEMRAGEAQAILVTDDGAPIVAAMSVAPPAGPRTSTDPASTDAAPSARNRPAGALPGILVVFASSPELSWTDLPIKPLMVPLVQEIVRQGVGLGSGALHARVGEQLTLPASVTTLASIEERVERDGRPRWRVDASAGRSSSIDHAGLYRLLDSADQPVGLLAVDVDMAAGDTRAQSADTIMAWLRGSGAWAAIEVANPSAALGSIEGGAPISLALLIAAIVCAVAETILARRFSYASRPRETSVGEVAA